MLYLPSGTLCGYKKWNLEDISYVGMNTIPASSCSYCFMGEDMKPMTGEYLTPSKKPLVQRKQSAFPSAEMISRRYISSLRSISLM